MFTRNLVVTPIGGDPCRIHRLDISNEQIVKINGYVPNCVLEGNTEDLNLNLERFQGMIDLTNIRVNYLNVICGDLPVKILVSEFIGGLIEIETNFPHNTRIYEVSGISENILFYCSERISHISADFGTFEKMTIKVRNNEDSYSDVTGEEKSDSNGGEEESDSGGCDEEESDSNDNNNEEGLFSGNMTTLLVGRIGQLHMENVLFTSNSVSMIDATFVKMETNVVPKLGPSVEVFEMRAYSELKKSRPIPPTVSSLKIFNCNWVSVIELIDVCDSKLQSLAIDGYFEQQHLLAIPKCVKTLEIFDTSDHDNITEGRRYSRRRGSINFPKIVDLNKCNAAIRNFTYTTHTGIPFMILLNKKIEDLTINCTKSTEYRVSGVEQANSLKIVRVAGNPTFDSSLKFGSQITTILAPQSTGIHCTYENNDNGDDLVHFVPYVPYSADIAAIYANSELRWLVADSDAITLKSMPERHYLHLTVTYADIEFNLSAGCAEQCVFGYTDFKRKPDRELIKWIKDMKRCIRHHSGETPEIQCGVIIKKPSYAERINVIWR